MDREFINSYNDYVDNGNAWFNLNPLSKLLICMCIGLSAVVVRRWQLLCGSTDHRHLPALYQELSHHQRDPGHSDHHSAPIQHERSQFHTFYQCVRMAVVQGAVHSCS